MLGVTWVPVEESDRIDSIENENLLELDGSQRL
jgi:hypothetical protein